MFYDDDDGDDDDLPGDYPDVSSLVDALETNLYIQSHFV